MGTFATDDPDKNLTTIWEFTDLFLGNVTWGIVTRMLFGLLVHFDKQMLFPFFLCFSGQRGTVALELSLRMRSIFVS